MKTIEEFTLKNMIVIEKYLNNEMTEKEKAKFLTELEEDDELREDFELAKASLKSENKNQFRPIRQHQKNLFDLPVFSINKKRSLGKKITKDGLLYITIATLMLTICGIILYIIA